MRRTAIATLLLLATSFTHPLAASEGETAARRLTFERLEAPEAMTLLRTLLEMKQLEMRGTHELEARDVPARLDLAQEVLAAVHAAPGPEPQTLETDDETVIVVIPLGTVGARDAMYAMRGLQVARIVPLTSLNVMVIRDSVERTKAAVEHLQGLASEPQP
jgi:hypothetical protein